MYNFIRLQYKMGKITEEQVLKFVPKWITLEEANQIIGKNYTDMTAPPSEPEPTEKDTLEPSHDSVTEK